MASAAFLKQRRNIEIKSGTREIVIDEKFEFVLGVLQTGGAVLKNSSGAIVGVVLNHAEYELLQRAAFLAQNPECLVDLIKRKIALETGPLSETLSLEQAFGEVKESKYVYSE